METTKEGPRKDLTAEQYLANMGMYKNNTVLIAFIDGVARNPSLVELIRGYRQETCEHNFVAGVCTWCGKAYL